jgi:alpha-methylacyl-CoA racemase
MMLADLGAEIVRIDRADAVGRPAVRPRDPLSRSRRSVAVELKDSAGAALVLRLVGRADVLVEGFRPGVMERLGLGPDECRRVNRRLVYGRLTGWGQSGPRASAAGHDINYLAAAGALHPLGRAGAAPHAPTNLVADFGGGGMLLAVGVLAALYERASSGEGQVVDAAMVDGSALLTAFLHGLLANGDWAAPRGTNLLDGGAPFYDTYETLDGEWMSVGALEHRFYRQLLIGLELADAALPHQMDRSGWPILRTRFATAFRSRTRAEWTAIFAGTDACVEPVLSLGEAPSGSLAQARQLFVTVDGFDQPAPAPRFDRTPAEYPTAAPVAGQHSRGALLDWGLSELEVDALVERGTVVDAERRGVQSHDIPASTGKTTPVT